MKILFLNKRLLFPPDTGGRIRTLNVVRHLARWHDVTYLCNVKPGEEQFFEAMRDLGVRLISLPWRETPRGSPRFWLELAANLLSPWPYNVNKDFDRRVRNEAARLLSEESFDLVVCDFVQMGRNVIGLNCRASLLFEHNVEAQIFERHARTDRGWLRRRYMALQAAKMRRFEAAAGRHFDAVVAVSERDRRVFEEHYGWDHVQTIDTAVDIDYFRPQDVAEQPDRLVFVGSLDWLPNEDGVAWFVREVWPAIRQQRPGAVFQVVGRNPPKAVSDLSAVPGVEVVGTVPDVRPYVSSACVVVVPLRIGGGTRIKIFEALALGRPVVSTALGAEGLNLIDGEHLAIADAPEQFADTVVRLLADGKQRAELGARGRRLVTDHYSAETIARQFERICCEAVAARGTACAAAKAVGT